MNGVYYSPGWNVAANIATTAKKPAHNIGFVPSLPRHVCIYLIFLHFFNCSQLASKSHNCFLKNEKELVTKPTTHATSSGSAQCVRF